MMTINKISYQNYFLPRLRYQYCPMCTAPLTRAVVNDDNIPRILCPACGWIHYPTNVIGVCVVVKHQDKIVAILPENSPSDMPAAFPAGHCEYGESPEQAAIREVLEETGLEIELEGCLGWHFNPQSEYPGPNVTFFYEAHSKSGELRGSQEGRTATFHIEQFPSIAPSRKGSSKAMELYLVKLQDRKDFPL